MGQMKKAGVDASRCWPRSSLVVPALADAGNGSRSGTDRRQHGDAQVPITSAPNAGAVRSDGRAPSTERSAVDRHGSRIDQPELPRRRQSRLPRLRRTRCSPRSSRPGRWTRRTQRRSRASLRERARTRESRSERWRPTRCSRKDTTAARSSGARSVPVRPASGRRSQGLAEPRCATRARGSRSRSRLS